MRRDGDGPDGEAVWKPSGCSGWLAVLATTLVGISGLTACREATPGPLAQAASLEKLLEAGALLSIGTEDDPLIAFERIRDARISPDGRHIAVLDANPPFLRVFRRDGTLRTSAIGMGEGPGESRSAYGLALGDDRVLVLDQGFKLLDLDGNVLVERRAAVAGVMPLAALRGCSDDWILYGPAVTASGGGPERIWISRLRVDSAGDWTVESLFVDRTASSVGYGARQFVGRSARELLVLHRYGEPPRLLRARCGAESTWASADDLGFLIQPGPVIELSSDRPNPDGFVFTRDGLLWSDWVWRLPPGWTDPEQMYTETRLTLVTADSVFDGTVSGDWALLDARSGHDVLLGTTEPYPRVLLVDASTLTSVIHAGTGRRR